MADANAACLQHEYLEKRCVASYISVSAIDVSFLLPVDFPYDNCLLPFGRLCQKSGLCMELAQVRASWRIKPAFAYLLPLRNCVNGVISAFRVVPIGVATSFLSSASLSLSRAHSNQRFRSLFFPTLACSFVSCSRRQRASSFEVVNFFRFLARPGWHSCQNIADRPASRLSEFSANESGPTDLYSCGRRHRPIMNS